MRRPRRSGRGTLASANITSTMPGLYRLVKPPSYRLISDKHVLSSTPVSVMRSSKRKRLELVLRRTQSASPSKNSTPSARSSRSSLKWPNRGPARLQQVVDREGGPDRSAETRQLVRPGQIQRELARRSASRARSSGLGRAGALGGAWPGARFGELRAGHGAQPIIGPRAAPARMRLPRSPSVSAATSPATGLGRRPCACPWAAAS